jgi:predicted phosphodiesterase
MMIGNSWALGSAPLVKPSTKEEDEVVLFLSDLHFPFQNQELVDSALRLAKKLKPHRIVLNGDINDFFQLSRFNTGLERLDDLQNEIDESNTFRAKLRKACPNSQIDETLGNHDHRLLSYVQQHARALTSLRALTPEKLLMSRELEITRYDGSGFRLRPNFLVQHGTIVRKYAGWSARAELEKAGISGTSGHTHRLGIYRQRSYTNLQWAESGCLCGLNPDYVPGAANWQNGAIIGHFSTQSDAFVLEEIQALDNKLFYAGRCY